MSNKNKKEIIKAKVEEYFDIRKIMFHNMKNVNELMDPNKEKHIKINEIADFLNNREFENFFPKFQKIVSDQIEGCDHKTMLAYLIISSTKYLECLDKQKVAIFDLIDNEIKPLVTIIDSGDSIYFHTEQ